MTTTGRESWGNHCEFFLSSLGLAVGLGNVWRFPFICYENGGGSFLIPYITMLFIVGIPMFFLEQTIGQYGRVGANKVFGRMVPLFQGLGYSMLLVRFLVNIYYTVVCSWSFYYLFAGLTAGPLPWSQCDGDWNTDDCYSAKLADPCYPDTYYKGRCCSVKEYCESHDLIFVEDQICSDVDGSRNLDVKDWIASFCISPAEDYFNGLTKDSEGNRYDWKDFGSLRWELSLCLLLSWILICLIMIKGLRSYGKVSYVITLSPYVVLTALLVYASTLDGAFDGIRFFIQPEWSKLSDVKIWAAASSQIFFSLSVGFGSQLALSSYNDFRNNVHRDAFLIGIFNSLTSLYAGIVVFAILGFIAKQTNTDISEVVKGGIGLAFMTYPSAVLEMDIPPFWSFLFFFMLINLALSSICGGFQTILALILDEKSSLSEYRTRIVIGLSIVFYLGGLSMCTNSGILLFTVFDSRCTSSLIFLSFLEVVVVSRFYGISRLMENMKEMEMNLWIPFRWIWKLLWNAVTPVLLFFIVVFHWIDHNPMKYDEKPFPDAVEIFGWLLELLPLFSVVIWSMFVLARYWKRGNRGKELWIKVTSPSTGWYTVQRGSVHLENGGKKSKELI